MRYSIPKGLFDIVPEEQKSENAWKSSDKWQYLENQIRKIATEFGFLEIRTPIFERTELFVRGVGESSDIVSKEMYTFDDKAGRSMSLRPEGTAPVIRSFVENGLQQLGSYHKFFYIGPYFRYDRPQAGRYRQFHQFGVEAIGNGSPEQDVEVIAMLHEFYKRLGLSNWELLLNTVGDKACRDPYKEALKNYLKPHFEKLSDDSKVRFEKNPLRILDTKDENERKLLEGAPSIHDYLSEKSKKHFDAVCAKLQTLDIPFTITPKLVRGLDYYNETVYEFTTKSLGAQNSISAGGRYDGLIKELGGSDLPSTGFAGGMERLLLTMDAQKCAFPKAAAPFIYFVPLDTESYAKAFELTHKFRQNFIPTDLAPSMTKVQKGLQLAEKKHATYAIVLGENEIQNDSALLKHLETRQETPVKLTDLLSTVRNLHANT